MGVRTCLHSLTIISFSNSYVLIPVFWTPSGSLTSAILRGLALTNKRTQTRKIIGKACKTSIGNETILDGLVLSGDGLLSRLSLLCQFEVRFG